MASHFETITGALQATVAASVTGVRYRTGQKFVQERTALPRVVWTLDKDTYDAARANGQRARAVRTRRMGVLAHVFGATIEQAESVVHAIAYAAHANGHGSYSIESGEWLEPTWLEEGIVCVVRLTFDVPITEPAKIDATINAVGFDTDNATSGDGVLETGEV